MELWKVRVLVRALWTAQKDSEVNGNSWKSEEELKPFRLQHCFYRPEY